MISDRIRWLRNRQNLTQSELAERLEMSEQQVFRWENGKSEPSLEAMVKLAKVFDVTGDYLLGLSDDPRGNRAVELREIEVDLIRALRESDFVSFTALLNEDLRSRD